MTDLPSSALPAASTSHWRAFTTADLERMIAGAARELATRSPLAAIEALTSPLPTLGWAAPSAIDGRHPDVGSTSAHTMFGINEATPGQRWKTLFDATWPGYRAWYLQEGEQRRPGLATARAMLVRHMPELVSTWEALVVLAGQDEVAARMLTMWDTPAFLPGCSQAVLTGEHPGLVRNYDYSPELFEWVVYTSAFTGRRVIGTSDCLWGLLDGMNEDGLVVSLTFGGRRGHGPGFAIPLVVRYLLEVATTVEEAKSALTGMPVSMCYNLTLTDRSGAVATAFVAPGLDPEFSAAPVATNHRGTVPEDPQHAERFRSVERQQHLLAVLDTQPDLERLAEEFLTTPLYSRDYAGAFGTVYTAVYRPEEGSVEYRWPDTTFRRTFDCSDDTVSVLLRQAPAAA